MSADAGSTSATPAVLRHPTSGIRRADGGRGRGDSGQAGGAEVLPLGLLTFVLAMLLIANAWGVVDADLATTSAAREAVRAFVESPDEPSAHMFATGAALEAMAGHGRSTDSTRVDISYVGGGGWARCSRVAVTVRHPMPAIRIPVIGGYGHAFDVVATSTEVIDPYRGGLEGEARC